MDDSVRLALERESSNETAMHDALIVDDGVDDGHDGDEDATCDDDDGATLADEVQAQATIQRALQDPASQGTRSKHPNISPTPNRSKAEQTRVDLGSKARAPPRL
jgi:hypothetical protein